MSDQLVKQQRNRRLQLKKVKIQKQYKIAKEYHRPSDGKWRDMEEPHRLHKKHAMNCGDPNCTMCGNPRKFFGEPTIQEQKFNQNIDAIRDKHSNGLLPEEV